MDVHPFTHSLTHSLTVYSLFPSFPLSLPHSLTHSLTPSLTHSFPPSLGIRSEHRLRRGHIAAHQEAKNREEIIVYNLFYLKNTLQKNIFSFFIFWLVCKRSTRVTATLLSNYRLMTYHKTCRLTLRQTSHQSLVEWMTSAGIEECIKK